MKRTVRVGRKSIEVDRTIVDRVVEYFDPVRGAQRARARFATAMANSYVGAARDRRQTKAWVTSGWLRIRSRERSRSVSSSGSVSALASPPLVTQAFVWRRSRAAPT